MSDGPDWQHRGRRSAHLTPADALLVWRKVAWPLCHPLRSGLGGLTPPDLSLLVAAPGLTNQERPVQERNFPAVQRSPGAGPSRGASAQATLLGAGGGA